MGFDKENIKIVCNSCGSEMEICGSEPPYYAHCLNKSCGANENTSIIFVGRDDSKLIAEHWVSEKLQDGIWLKKDAIEWLNGVWKEYRQWCYDNY